MRFTGKKDAFRARPNVVVVSVYGVYRTLAHKLFIPFMTSWIFTRYVGFVFETEKRRNNRQLIQRMSVTRFMVYDKRALLYNSRKRRGFQTLSHPRIKWRGMNGSSTGWVYNALVPFSMYSRERNVQYWWQMKKTRSGKISGHLGGWNSIVLKF